MDIKKQPNQLQIKPPKKHKDKKPDKLIWILGVVAVLFVGMLVTVFVVTKTKPNNNQAEDATIPSVCPGANKQHPGHCISSNISSLALQPGKPFEYKFQIQDGSNKPITNFQVGHEKIMHVLLIRKDRIGFQHLHPEFDKTSGTFTLKNVVIPQEGSYRIFADFIDANVAEKEKATIAVYEDFQVGNSATANKSVSSKEITKTFGNTEVVLITQPEILSVGANTKLTLLIGNISANGAPVNDLRPYLGAFGHAVLFDDQLNLVHTHATSSKSEAEKGIVEFSFTPSQAGSLALFAQVQRGSEVVTSDFGLHVNKSLSEIDNKINSGAHEGH